jgi:hypothetical protein
VEANLSGTGASVDRKEVPMSSSKRQQTMAKRSRELAVKERRALKEEKKRARKQAAEDARNGIIPAPDETVSESDAGESDVANEAATG